MNAIHATPVQIRFNDIDIAGHVNNAVHFEYYDVARVAYFNTVLANLVQWKKEGFVLAHMEMDYMTPAFLDDMLTIYTKITKVGEKSITMFQEIRKTNNENELVSSCQSVLVSFDYQNHLSILLPSTWRQAIVDYEHLDG
jgi:acyl-CoA thioester hydrolase